MFSIRLVTADSYQAVPISDLDVTFSEFRGSEVKQVPIIRVFGTTETGEKACLHIHGVFPYIYVPCMVKQNVDGFMYQLATALDNAINNSLGHTRSNKQHVYKIQHVSGIPLYGYHEREHQFFKIYLYTPAMIKRATDLLQNGLVLNQSLQPNEAHISFILQFMIDYGVYGMSFINVQNVKYRRHMHLQQKEMLSENSDSGDFHDYLETRITRQSTCRVEADVRVSDVLNRRAIVNGLGLNPGLTAIWEEERTRRAEAGLQSANTQLVYPKSSNQPNLPLTENDEYQLNRWMQRLNAISQINEEISLSNSSVTSYPLEIKDDNKLSPASYIVNHIVQESMDKIEKDITKYNNPINTDFIQLSEVDLSRSRSNDTADLLDEEDRKLIEMLEDLAEEDDVIRAVDNDSVLGSQCSALEEEVKSDNEDNEAFNITCADLDTLSPWDLSDRSNSQRSNRSVANDQNLKDTNTDDIATEARNQIFSILSQCDGTHDEIVGSLEICATKYQRKLKNTNILLKEKIKQKYNKNSEFKVTKDISHLNLLDHADLDVYDIDEIQNQDNLYETIETKDDTGKCFTKFSKSAGDKNWEKIEIFEIPAFDGNASDSSSDCEKETDVTINKEEKRVCIYKTKETIRSSVVNVTPRKKKRDDHNDELLTPHKRHKSIDFKMSNNTPVKTQPLKSPSCSSGCYSPLNITVTSPCRGNTRMDNSTSINNQGNCTTPRRRSRLTLNRKFISPRVIIEEDEMYSVYQENNDDKTNTIPTAYNDTEKKNIEVYKKIDIRNGHDEDKRMSETVSNEKLGKSLSRKSQEVDTSKDKVDRTRTDIENLLNTEIFTESKIERSKQDIIQYCNTSFTQFVNQRISLSNQSLSDRTLIRSVSTQSVVITTKFTPPSRSRILESMEVYEMPRCKHKRAFYGDRNDLEKNKDTLNDIAAVFKSRVKGVTSINLWRRMKVNEFHPSGASIKSSNMRRMLATYSLSKIRPLIEPPTTQDVKKWLKAKEYILRKNEAATKNVIDKIDTDDSFCLEMNRSEDQHNNEAINQNLNLDRGDNDTNPLQFCVSTESLDPSLQSIAKKQLLVEKKKESHHFGISYGDIDYSSRGSGSNVMDNLQNARALITHQYLTIFCMEVHVMTREELLPDPEKDSIHAVFYAIENDVPMSSTIKQSENGAIVIDPFTETPRLKRMLSSSTTCAIYFVANEEELYNNLITLIGQHDPDILIGWEVETLSWGYVIQRAPQVGYDNFSNRISRIQSTSTTQQNSERDEINDIKITGRVVLDVWRIMRHEAALLNYTFENVTYNVLRERIPCPDFKTLTNWWRSSGVIKRSRVIEHYTKKVLGIHRILNHLDIIGRTSEHARLFGIQFYEVFSRGSQFRVESMMLRLAKPLNYIAISPSVQQRANMRAPASLPLIMEPESKFYTDPVIVLDFQSLYPSMIIAYNYCFSTCLGRIEHIGQDEPFEFGAASLRVRGRTAFKLQDSVNFSPCGVAFVKPQIRQGILPRMLSEILNTRLMVKESMKLHSSKNQVLQRVLDSRQLGLKLISNVTYGYTSANFSGRMPCIEIGDSVVSKGRETLERAIKLVESTSKWGARVVYGDTDSLFILLAGKSREEAFEIGYEIADSVTKLNPPPVKLKFEKVLHPCILQTKKRYCGYMYESSTQKKPQYLAKGIETVRRDGCPAIAKILEKTLKILFETKDVSLVKRYVTRQLEKILQNRASIQNLIFAREFRGMKGYKANACVPSLELTRRLIQKDPRAIPRVGERVQYVIVAGAPNEALIRCVRTPRELMSNSGLYVNSLYYVTKVIIPPLNRCLNLLGIDVNTWYREMSHNQYNINKLGRLPLESRKEKITICQFFHTFVCAICGEQSNKEICTECMSQPNYAIVKLNEKLRCLERSFQRVNEICHSCVGRLDDPECTSLDCPVFYRKTQVHKDSTQTTFLRGLIDTVGESLF